MYLVYSQCSWGRGCRGADKHSYPLLNIGGHNVSSDAFASRVPPLSAFSSPKDNTYLYDLKIRKYIM